MERNCELRNTNRIGGVTKWGERATNREAPVAKTRRRRCGDGAGKDCVLTWGGLALCLKGRRCEPEREVSRGRSSRGTGEGPNEKDSEVS